MHPDAAAPPSGTCTEKSCASGGDHLCHYVDRLGVACATYWCDAHVRLIGGKGYCRRHASTLLAVRTVGGDTTEGTLPPVTNRAASLVRWMVRELDDPLRNLLYEFLRPDETIQSRGRANLEQDGRWSWEWSATSLSDAPVRIEVLLTVDEASDDTVIVTVNGNEVHSAVPPWIIHNQRRETVSVSVDVQERAEYSEALLSAVRGALKALA